MFTQFPHVQASLNLCSTSPLKYSGRGMLTEVKSVHLNKLILLPQLRSQLLLLLVNGWTLPRQLLTAKEREKINMHIFLLKSQPTVQNEKKMKKKKSNSKDHLHTITPYTQHTPYHQMPKYQTSDRNLQIC